MRSGKKSTESKRPRDTPFTQQKLQSWSLRLSPYGVAAGAIALGIALIPIGSKLLLDCRGVSTKRANASFATYMQVNGGMLMIEC